MYQQGIIGKTFHSSIDIKGSCGETFWSTNWLQFNIFVSGNIQFSVQLCFRVNPLIISKGRLVHKSNTI